jgi:hypothetical protein
VDGCSSPSEGSFSSTVSTNLRTASIAGPLSLLDRLERLLG